MTDREKVIKGLKFCSKCCSQNCPYFESDACIALLANDTLAMLKEQEPDHRPDWFCADGKRTTE